MKLPSSLYACVTMLPLPVAPSPNSHRYWTAAPVLACASNTTACPCDGLVGLNVKLGVRLIGGRRMPGGTSRIWTARPTAFAALVPTGVATISMNVSLPMLRGAVYASVALPAEFVVALRADSHPKSMTCPPDRISIVITTPGFGLPNSSNVVMVICDCDAPSCVSTSGDAASVTEVPYSDGPVSGGASWLFMVQDADSTIAIAAVAKLRFMKTLISVMALDPCSLIRGPHGSQSGSRCCPWR